MSGILVTGAGGLVGGKVVRQLLESNAEPVHAVYHHLPTHIPSLQGLVHIYALDITSTKEIAKLIVTIEPKLVLHIAAMTNVDACERERELAYTINVTCTAAIAEAAAAVRAKLLYVSTDYVFDGSAQQPGPYTEESPTYPLNYYGLTKLQGEEAVQKYCATHTDWAICRTSVVYGLTSTARMNFALWLLKEMRARHQVQVVVDQFSTPTLADHLASMLIKIGQSDCNGVYHTAGADCLSRLSFAQQLADAFLLDSSLLLPITTSTLRQPASRPLYAGLLCGRIRSELSIQPLLIHEGIALLHEQ